MCGTVSEDWIDDRGRVKDDLPYEDHSVYCAGCHLLETARDDVPKDKKGYTHVYLRPVVRKRKRESSRKN
jgi:hypothetical protein